MKKNEFLSRHVGPDKAEEAAMLEVIGVSNLDELISETVPANIRMDNKLNLEPGIGEYEYLNHLREIAKQNQVFSSYIGLGFNNCITPPVIQRNILENPGWYTAYTPYQAEISQGRLEALINFQTMVTDLTSMELANASLLDEATAAGEAMIMLYNSRSREEARNGKNQFFVSDRCFPQTIEVLKTRSTPLDIELVIGDLEQVNFGDKCFGLLLQYPDKSGGVLDYTDLVAEAARAGVKVAVAADLLSLTLLKPPGEWGADVVVGSTQRFGVPLGFGGPHAAYFATKEEYKRQIPGRIIGVSQDAQGNPAYRMALQTREQHIKRGKATSNICTSQVLLAVMAGMYAVYHGSKGLKSIAERIHLRADALNRSLQNAGHSQLNEHFFDTLLVQLKSEEELRNIKKAAEENSINLLYLDNNQVGVSLNETTSEEDLSVLAELFGGTLDQKSEQPTPIHPGLTRTSEYLMHPVFNTHHSESELMRYMKTMENKDLSLTHSMIPLGSCTMKLNAVAELLPLTWPEFAAIHPYAPKEQVTGYLTMIDELEKYLCEVTGFDAISLQPNSGAQGEYAGLMVIKAYQDSIGQEARKVVLIPASAHGTNPASAVMAGLSVVVVNCDKHGNIDFDDLKQKANDHSADLCAFMVTYPSTHGVFEEGIKDITKIIHENGGQVYMDGANMNAQIGLTNPAIIGADVCHLNLHKTFAIPHGGGGPGMGPIGVAKHLAPFLPGHANVQTGGTKAIHSISQAPWGSALILWISYGYIKMLGGEGLTHATKIAILNANYIKSKLEAYYPILYKGVQKGRVAHEMIVDCREFKKTAGIEVQDIAKRLIDYGYHAPTVSFPVAGTLMIEPTESEALHELDKFCDAMISIRSEIAELEDGTADRDDNVLVNAPHSIHEVTADAWNHVYNREKAAYPREWTRASKYWVPVSRIDNAFGDRNLICACPPMSDWVDNPPILSKVD